MSRRSEDLYERDAPDRRVRDPRYLQQGQESPERSDSRQQIDPRDPRQQIDPIDSRRQIDPRDPRERIDPREPRQQIDPRDSRRQIDPRDPRERIDPRDVRRQQIDPRDPRERIDPRDPRQQIDPRDLRQQRDRRDPYSYANQTDRDDTGPLLRSYTEDLLDRREAPIQLEVGRREDLSLRYENYWIPAEDINREVIQYDICRYLGNEATVRPYIHPDGRQGYLIKAYRALTTAMIATLKRDSKRFEVEQAKRQRQSGQSGVLFGASATFDDRQRQGRPDVPQSGYAGYGMDTDMDDYEDDRGRGYRLQESRMDSRLNPRQDPRQDPGQQVLFNRHNQMPAVSQGYSQDPSYPTTYQLQSVSDLYDPTASQVRTLGPSNAPPPSLSAGGQTAYAGGYPVASAALSIPPLAYARSNTSRPSRAGAGHPGWGDTPNFGRDPAR